MAHIPYGGPGKKKDGKTISPWWRSIFGGAYAKRVGSFPQKYEEKEKYAKAWH